MPKTEYPESRFRAPTNMEMNRRKNDPVLREYARLASRYDSRWSSYVRLSVENTIARLPVREGQRVLDIGCGTGQLLAALCDRTPPAHSLGVDLSGEMLAVARSRLPNGFPLVASRAEQLPFLDASFDLIVSSSVFHYLREPKNALAEFRRLLKPNGGLLITDWCDDYLSCKLLDVFLRVFSRAHKRTYTRQQLGELLHEASFEPLTIDTYRVGGIWGLMTARAVKRGT